MKIHGILRGLEHRKWDDGEIIKYAYIRRVVDDIWFTPHTIEFKYREQEGTIDISGYPKIRWYSEAWILPIPLSVVIWWRCQQLKGKYFHRASEILYDCSKRKQRSSLIYTASLMIRWADSSWVQLASRDASEISSRSSLALSDSRGVYLTCYSLACAPLIPRHQLSNLPVAKG